MLTFLKILFFPVWFPVKVLLFASKVLACILCCAVLALLIAVVLR
jgi:hypothetical protein